MAFENHTTNYNISYELCEKFIIDRWLSTLLFDTWNTKILMSLICSNEDKISNFETINQKQKNKIQTLLKMITNHLYNYLSNKNQISFLNYYSKKENITNEKEEFLYIYNKEFINIINTMKIEKYILLRRIAQ